MNLHENLMQAEIGFTLCAEYQGLGYGREAVTRLLDHLFADRGLHKVSAECDARNAASARLLTRVGFLREGLRRSHTWIKGEWTDDLEFGLLASRSAAQPVISGVPLGATGRLLFGAPPWNPFRTASKIAEP